MTLKRVDVFNVEKRTITTEMRGLYAEILAGVGRERRTRARDRRGGVRTVVKR